MAFQAILALAIGTFVLLPWLAHRLRRSPPRERIFAPLRFVAETTSPSNVPSGIDDRGLFAVRTIIVVLLALLGAGLRTRSHGLSLRTGDENASLVVLIDDSLSMQTVEGSTTRFDQAKDAVYKVLADLDGGDRVALVLGGKPARILRGFSQDIGAVRRAVKLLEPSDRGTDLHGAILLAEGLASDAAAGTVSLIVATDGRGGAGPIAIDTALPLRIELVPSLRTDDCAVIEARGRLGAVDVSIACEKPAHRRVQWLRSPGEITAIEADLGEGTTLVQLISAGALPRGTVALEARDGVASDDAAPVLDGPSRMRVAVVDSATGVDDEERTPRALFRALEAVAPQAEVLRAQRIPTDSSLLALDVLALDNAAPWTADTRLALQAAVEGGLAVIVTLGPVSARGGLGASFDPFLDGPVGWESGQFGLLLPGSEGPMTLDARARFVANAPGSEVIEAFDDGSPFMVRTPRGEGFVTWIAAPADPRLGDVAIRAGFIDGLAEVVDRARRTHPRGLLRVGEALLVSAGAQVTGPAGPVPVTVRNHGQGEGGEVDLAIHGTYSVEAHGTTHVRQVILDEEEILGHSLEISSRGGIIATQESLRDRSPWVVVLLVIAVCAEAALRLRASGRSGAPGVTFRVPRFLRAMFKVRERTDA